MAMCEQMVVKEVLKMHMEDERFINLGSILLNWRESSMKFGFASIVNPS